MHREELATPNIVINKAWILKPEAVPTEMSPFDVDLPRAHVSSKEAVFLLFFVPGGGGP